ncbi:COPT2 protein, partial [Sterrhoptilus dennistouni]|nr:COPT2 protein [Sterrhoptilus dennistouni]
PAGMVLSVLVILLLSVLYEAVKMGKAPPPLSLLPKPPSGHSRLPVGGNSSSPSPSLMAFPISFPRWFWFHVGQTLFHVVQVVLGYMVMLAVMSYNAWIFLGAIVGSTLGYFM